LTVVDELTITYVISKSTDATVWPFEPSFRVQTRTGEKVATVFTVVSDFIAQTRLLPSLADRPPVARTRRRSGRSAGIELRRPLGRCVPPARCQTPRWCAHTSPIPR
jgi:hypothetical protein